MDKSKSASMIYDKIVNQYAESFHEPSDHIDEFLKYLPAQGKILDIGCGTGTDSNYMDSLGFQVTGIDLSSGMVQFAKKKYPNINFQVGDARKLAFDKNSFNGILAACFLIHIPKEDIQQLLSNFNSFLKENGVIYIALQAGKSEEVFIDEPFKPDEKLFLNIISYDEISDLLLKTGFTILHKFERNPKSKGEIDYTKLYVIAQKSRKPTET